MSISELIKTIEDEIMVYSHVRDVNTGWVADLIVMLKNDMAAGKTPTKTITTQDGTTISN